MQYDDEMNNSDEMAELMEQAQAAEANGRYNDALALLNQVATNADESEDKMFAAGTAALIIFNNFLNGNTPKFGTSLYNDCYKFLKIAVESYDDSHPMAQEMFRQNTNIDRFRSYLAQMEKEMAASRINSAAEQSASVNSPIYLFKNNQRFGPYEENAVRQWLQNGQCSPNDFGWRNGMKDWQPLSSLFSLATENKGLPDIKPYDAPAKFSFTLSDLIQLDETSVESTISYLLATNPEYKAEREQTKKEASRHLKTIFATKIWSPYEIKSFYWFSADKTGTHLKLSFDLYTIPAPVHMNYMVGRVHFEMPLNAPDGQIEKTWISIVSEEEIQENIEMLNEE